MKIISWNVNGIRAALRKGFMDFLSEHDPDILCLQETKAHKEQVEIDLPGYHEFWHSGEKKGYSSTAIFTKTEPIQVLNGLLPEVASKYDLVDDQGRDGSKEGRIISAEYDDFYLVTVYTPNSKRDLSRLGYRHEKWDPSFLEHVQELEKKKPVVFCGDLNVAHQEIDLARPKSNEGEHGFTKEEREGFDNIVNAGYIDSFRKFNQEGENYTWWTHWAKARERNVGWRIDYFCVSQQLDDRLTDAFILPEVMGSDHCPVGIELVT